MTQWEECKEGDEMKAGGRGERREGRRRPLGGMNNSEKTSRIAEGRKWLEEEN